MHVIDQEGNIVNEEPMEFTQEELQQLDETGCKVISHTTYLIAYRAPVEAPVVPVEAPVVIDPVEIEDGSEELLGPLESMYEEEKVVLEVVEPEPMPEYMNATQVGELTGVSNRKVNTILSEVGMILRQGKKWKLTETGKTIGKMIKGVCRWTDKVIDLILGHLSGVAKKPSEGLYGAPVKPKKGWLSAAASAVASVGIIAATGVYFGGVQFMVGSTLYSIGGMG